MASVLTERVNQLLETKHLPKGKVAEELGVDYSTFWRKLRGERSIDITFLRKLTSILGTSAAYLLGETDDPTPPGSSGGTALQRVSKVTLDLEGIIKDLVYEHPDLAIGFRDTRQNWKILPDGTKQAIADGLAELFDPEKQGMTSLKTIGKRGQV